MARPKKPDVIGIKIRVPKTLLARLEKAAGRGRRSTNREISLRLQLSLETIQTVEEQVAGVPHP